MPEADRDGRVDLAPHTALLAGMGADAAEDADEGDALEDQGVGLIGRATGDMPEVAGDIDPGWTALDAGLASSACILIHVARLLSNSHSEIPFGPGDLLYRG